jgi:hypothetical protein
MATDDEAYHELAAYTLGLHDAAFIHQHIVDAYAVHAAMPTDKPIRIAQALVGLFLHVEHGLTGRQVQRGSPHPRSAAAGLAEVRAPGRSRPDHHPQRHRRATGRTT